MKKLLYASDTSNAKLSRHQPGSMIHKTTKYGSHLFTANLGNFKKQCYKAIHCAKQKSNRKDTIILNWSKATVKERE